MCVDAAGYLVAINDFAEQAFIARHFTANRYWIGLSDSVFEGLFFWDTGEPLTYSNWCPGEPNNFGNEDAVEFGSSQCPGGWNDVPTAVNPNNPPLAIVEFAPVIDPVTRHAYVLTPKADFFTVRAAAESSGGHLAVINSASENALVTNMLPPDEYIWIGLTDAATEGVFVWDNGDPVTYPNWAPWFPLASSPSHDYVFIYNGSWHDDLSLWSQRGVVEIPFASRPELTVEPGANLHSKPRRKPLAVDSR